MIFNSLDFGIFLPIVFLLYWFVFNKNLKAQNVLIIASSYLFYGWWDWRFLSLILFSSIIDFVVGIKIGRSKNKKERLVFLWLSILVNLGFLGFSNITISFWIISLMLSPFLGGLLVDNH
jgi:alginate O-acetyltransferase complex protein AlgI